MQQSRSATHSCKAGIEPEGSPAEVEADAVASHVVAGRRATVQNVPSGTIQRAPKRKHHPPPNVEKKENPTYTNARLYLDEWFAREAELAEKLYKAKHDGLENFNTYSSKEYNEHASLGLVLFELALTAIPAAAGLLAVLKELKVASASKDLLHALTGVTTAEAKVAKVAKEAEMFPFARIVTDLGAVEARRELEATEQTAKIAEATHHAAETAAKHAAGTFEAAHTGKLVQETAKQTGEVVEKAGARSEAAELADYRIEQINSLRQLDSAEAKQRWILEDLLRPAVEAWQFTPASIDLKFMVTSILGPMANPGALDTVDAVTEQFELQLYNDYYVTSGRAQFTTEETGWAAYPTPEKKCWEGLPEGVEKRMRSIPGGEALFLSNKRLKKEHRLIHGAGR